MKPRRLPYKRLMARLVLVSLAGLLSLNVALAAGEQLARSVVGSAGGAVSQGGVTMRSAVGQLAVGAVEDGSTLCSGFVCGPGAPPVVDPEQKIYLPLVLR